jgi:DNA-directed RNA polymerase subunit RPC12/RpoP
LFFDENTSQESKILFIQFVYEHLFKKANINSLKRERIYYCPECGEEVKDKTAIASRLEKGKKIIPCLYCDERIPLIDLVEEKYGDQEVIRKVKLLEKGVVTERGKEVGLTTSRAKDEIGEYDVFLAHNSSDKTNVMKIAGKLRERGINPWIDKEQIPPGRWFQDVIQEAIPKVKSAAIFIGPKDIGRWQALELRAFISECIDRNIPVIPVLLPSVEKLPGNLIFLKELNWVKFNYDINDTKALDDLIWGITGKRTDVAL